MLCLTGVWLVDVVYRCACFRWGVRERGTTLVSPSYQQFCAPYHTMRFFVMEAARVLMRILSRQSRVAVGLCGHGGALGGLAEHYCSRLRRTCFEYFAIVAVGVVVLSRCHVSDHRPASLMFFCFFFVVPSFAPPPSPRHSEQCDCKRLTP